MRKAASYLLRYFFQGVIIISPIAITAWAAYSIFDFVDTKIPYVPRGIGFIIVISSLILIGWLGSTFLVWKFLIGLFDGVLERTPFLKFIYTSVKEVVESFMGDKKKFNRPVLVKVRANPELYQIGFITRQELSKIGLSDKIAVYMPHAYAVSGFLLIVDRESVQPLNMNPGDAMKMAVSGGMAGYDEEETETKKEEEIAHP
ncbi:MAG: DUF502 domain-containing protein [Chitinophagaceae bacterium]|nr:DUF502 domain-containing protein [Chitinophagaceae bacterium]